MLNDPIVIVSAARTPMGAFQGDLRTFTAPELGAAAIRAAVERAQIKPEQVQEVVMGCVLPAGQGQAPARQASLGAGLPLAAGCTTVNKMCGSGMKAAMFAHDLLAAGTNDIMVAGGMESMTNAPYLLPKARAGYRMGHQQVLDHMFFDGLEDAYDVTRRRGRLMGTFAEECAGKYAFTREEQDAFRDRLARARAESKQGRLVRVGDHAARDQGGQGREVHRERRAAVQGELREDPDAQAGVPQGRHGDRRQLVVDLRRRGGDGADAPLDRREARAEAARDHRRALDARAGAGAGSPPRRSARSASSTRRPAGARGTSTSTRSTRRSRSSRWRR